MPGQRGQHGVGDAANPHLDGGAVGDQGGHVLADGLLHLAGRLGRQLEERSVDGDQAIDPRHRDAGVAVGARHVGIHLGQHQLGALDGGPHHVDRHPQADEAVRVGRADLDEGHVDAHPPAADERRDLRQEHRQEVGPSVLHRLAHVRSDEEGGVPEARRELGAHVGGRPQGQEMHDLVVGQVLAVGHQRLDQPHRLGGSRADQDAAPRPDERHRLGGGCQLAAVALAPAGVFAQGRVIPAPSPFSATVLS
jgi:hypothetical protein